MSNGRTVIIGIDGVSFHVMRDLAKNDVMPHFNNLLKDGVFSPMESTIPEISSASWSTIVTGENPGEHGIYGFTDLIEGTYSLSFPNFRSLKAKPFWHKQDSKKHVIINVPSTYPAADLNGFLVSGFVALDLEKAVKPLSYLDLLRDMNYQIDVDSNKAYQSMPLFLKNLFKTHDKRVKLYRKMWEKIEWDTFMLVFTGSDRLEHFLMDAYDNPDHEFHEDFLTYFKKVDEAIGEINERLNEEDKLLMLSDHGMESISQNVNLNTFLQEHGFLKLGDNPKKRYNNIEEGSRAFALDPSRIYLNRKGKYPRGGVKQEEEQDILDDLISVFKDLKHENKPVLRNIYKKEEIYHGRYLDSAPDLVLLSQSGYSLRGSIGKKHVFEKPDHIIGMHTQPDAFLYVKKHENRDVVPKHPTVKDFTSIMNNAV